MPALPNLVAWFDALDTSTMLSGDGSTITDGGSVALWADKSGNSGVNAFVSAGGSGNYCTVADAAAYDVDDLDIRLRVAMADWTPSGNSALFTRWDGAVGNASWNLTLLTGGTLRMQWTTDGSTAVTATSTAAPTVSDLAAIWLRVTVDIDNGAGAYVVTFYTSANGSTWTQLGDAVTGGSTTTIYKGSYPLSIGATGAGGSVAAGIFYRAILKSGINGTDVADIDFSQSAKKLANGDTFVCATGQTVTLNSSGATGARIAGERDWYMGTLASRGTYNAAGRYIATDGSDDYYKTAAFPLPQPVTLYAVMEQSSWTSGDYLFDGSASDTLALIQTTSTPQINLSAGSSVAANTDLATATKALVTIVSNGASSLVSINRLPATTGNAGAGVPNGLTLASKGTAGSYGNARFYEIAVYRAAHDQATRHRFALYAARKWGFAA